MAETRERRIMLRVKGTEVGYGYTDRWVFDRITRIREYYKLGDLERLQHHSDVLAEAFEYGEIPEGEEI